MRACCLLVLCVIACGAGRVTAIGPTRWAASTPDPGPAPVRIAVDAAGNVISAVDDWIGERSAADGSAIWEITLPGQRIDRLGVSRAGDTIAIGTFGIASYAVPGTMQWDQPLPDGVVWTDLAIGSDGSLDVVGYQDTTTLLVASFAADGTPRWSRAFPGARNAASGFRIAATSDRELAIVGKTDDTTAFGLAAQLPCELLAFLTNDGLYRGAHVLPWAVDYALAGDHDGGVVLTSEDTVARYDRYGGERWDATSQMDEPLAALAVTSDGNLVTAGFAAFEAFDGAGTPLDLLPFGRGDVISIQAIAPLSGGAIAFAGRATETVEFDAWPVQGAFVGVFDAPR